MKKSRPFRWDILNFAGLVLVVIIALVYLNWPQRPSPYWFVFYEWTRGKEHGAGRRCIAVDDNGLDILKIEDMLLNKNKYDSLIVSNFVQINKTTYDLCIKQP